VTGSQRQSPGATLGDAHDRRLPNRAGIQHGHGVFAERQVPVEAGILRSIGRTVAETVIGDDPVVCGQDRHLVPPEVAVHDRPRRQQEHHVLAGAELLPCQSLPVAPDRTLCAGLQIDDHVPSGQSRVRAINRQWR
jgi:hypothetical protein